MKLKKDIQLFLRTTNCKISMIIAKKRLEICEENLINLTAESNSKKINDYIKEVEDDSGGFSQLRLWKLKAKLFNKAEEVSTAKKDAEGNLVTAPSSLKDL